MLFATLLVACGTGALSPSKFSTCRVCRLASSSLSGAHSNAKAATRAHIHASENHATSCAFHPGRLIRAENAKHCGTHTGPGGVELTVFWDCCSAPADAPGCCRQRHLTYDDTEGAENAISIEAALRMRGGSSARLRVLRHTKPLGMRRIGTVHCQELSGSMSDMEWRKRRSGDSTAKADETAEDAARCVPCENAAKRGVEIEQAIGMRAEGAIGDRKELAIRGLREALEKTASQAPAEAAEVLLAALGDAYMAGVGLEDRWMKAVADRVAAGEVEER